MSRVFAKAALSAKKSPPGSNAISPSSLVLLQELVVLFSYVFSAVACALTVVDQDSRSTPLLDHPQCPTRAAKLAARAEDTEATLSVNHK